jgi:hypothetical protein
MENVWIDGSGAITGVAPVHTCKKWGWGTGHCLDSSAPTTSSKCAQPSFNQDCTCWIPGATISATFRWWTSLTNWLGMVGQDWQAHNFENHAFLQVALRGLLRRRVTFLRWNNISDLILDWQFFLVWSLRSIPC